MKYGKPCARCLSKEAGGEELAELIAARIAGMPPDIRADEALAACLACEDLIGGMCAKCGCYVELRAARRHGYCPAARRMW